MNLFRQIRRSECARADLASCRILFALGEITDDCETKGHGAPAYTVRSTLADCYALEVRDR